MIQRIRELLARRPFTPFRVLLSSGDNYEVRHPETVLVLRGGIYIALAPKSNGQDALPERAVFCSALHLAGVEELIAS